MNCQSEHELCASNVKVFEFILGGVTLGPVWVIHIGGKDMAGKDICWGCYTFIGVLWWTEEGWKLMFLNSCPYIDSFAQAITCEILEGLCTFLAFFSLFNFVKTHTNVIVCVIQYILQQFVNNFKWQSWLFTAMYVRLLISTPYWPPKTLNLNYLASQSFDFERTWWILFQKRVVRTKFDIYVFSFI